MAPAYDTNAELTTMAAADILYEVMTAMVKRGSLSLKGDGDKDKGDKGGKGKEGKEGGKKEMK